MDVDSKPGNEVKRICTVKGKRKIGNITAYDYGQCVQPANDFTKNDKDPCYLITQDLKLTKSTLIRNHEGKFVGCNNTPQLSAKPKFLGTIYLARAVRDDSFRPTFEVSQTRGGWLHNFYTGRITLTVMDVDSKPDNEVKRICTVKGKKKIGNITTYDYGQCVQPANDFTQNDKNPCYLITQDLKLIKSKLIRNHEGKFVGCNNTPQLVEKPKDDSVFTVRVVRGLSDPNFKPNVFFEKVNKNSRNGGWTHNFYTGKTTVSVISDKSTPDSRLKRICTLKGNRNHHCVTPYDDFSPSDQDACYLVTANLQLIKGRYSHVKQQGRNVINCNTGSQPSATNNNESMTVRVVRQSSDPNFRPSIFFEKENKNSRNGGWTHNFYTGKTTVSVISDKSTPDSRLKRICTLKGSSHHHCVTPSNDFSPSAQDACYLVTTDHRLIKGRYSNVKQQGRNVISCK